MDTHDWKSLMAAWDSLVEETGKGIKANLAYGSIQTALRMLVNLGATPQEVAERGRHMILEETWRRPGYLTLSALQNGWESLGEEVGRKRSKEAEDRKRAQIEAQAVSERRERAREPVMDKEPIREWLRKNCPGLSSTLESSSQTHQTHQTHIRSPDSGRTNVNWKAGLPEEDDYARKEREAIQWEATLPTDDAFVRKVMERFEGEIVE